MNSDDTLYGRIKNRVLTISGNSPSIRVDGGCLLVSDGPMPVPTAHLGPAQLANDRMVTHRFRRADCPVDRIGVTRPEGFVTFAALKWQHDVGVSLAQLDWDGTVLVATAPRQYDLPAVRRSHAIAYETDLGRGIARDILCGKIKGQAAVARYMGNASASATIGDLANKLDDAHEVIDLLSIDLLSIEAMPASAYWARWADLRLRLAKRDRVPDHWNAFGIRRSPISGDPRSAATPGNAIMNYLYGVLRSQVTISLVGVGLDPGMGLLCRSGRSRG